MSNSRYELQEIIYEELYSLFDRPSAELFKYPVNMEEFPDYTSQIENPVDLSTIAIKFKQGKYKYLQNIEKDVKQIVKNCSLYHRNKKEIIDVAHQFNTEREKLKKSIKQQLVRRKISVHQPINITPEKLQFFQSLDQRRLISKLQTFLMPSTQNQPRNLSQKQEPQEKFEEPPQIVRTQVNIVEQVEKPQVKEIGQKIEEGEQKIQQKKKLSRIMRQYEEMEEERRRKEQEKERIAKIKEQDEQFIWKYSLRSNVLVIEKYGRRLNLDWQKKMIEDMRKRQENGEGFFNWI